MGLCGLQAQQDGQLGIQGQVRLWNPGSCTCAQGRIGGAPQGLRGSSECSRARSASELARARGPAQGSLGGHSQVSGADPGPRLPWAACEGVRDTGQCGHELGGVSIVQSVIMVCS